MKQFIQYSLISLALSQAVWAQPPDGYYHYYVYNDIAVSKEGRIVAVGTAGFPLGAMFTSLGLPPAWGWQTGMGIDWQGEKFIAVGGKVGRFNWDGTPDPTFGTGGIAPNLDGRDVKVLCNGKILVAHGGITRLMADGAIDPTFGANGLATGPFAINKIAVQADAKIVGIGDNQVTRFNEDGSVDPTFTQGILPPDVTGFSDLAIQGDGKIVVSANYNSATNLTDFAVLRFNQDGSIDNSFSGDGLVTLDINHDQDYATAVRVQSDGKIVTAGTVTIYNCHCPAPSTASIAVARFLADGTLDESFGEPSAILPYEGYPGFQFDGIGKSVIGNWVRVNTMLLYEDSIYLAGGTINSTKEGGTLPYRTSLFNDGRPLEVVNNASFPAAIPDAWALPQGVQPNTVYVGYAPASSITLAAQTDNSLSTYRWSTGATTSSITVSPASTQEYRVTITQPSGCYLTRKATVAVVDARCGANMDKVQICKAPPGNTGKTNNTCISPSAVPAQLKNGSMLAGCNPGAYEKVASGNYLTVYNGQNPTYAGFILEVQSTNITDRVTVRIYSADGHLQETRTIAPNSRMEAGTTFPAGLYYAEVIQGNNKQIVKLLKLK